MLNQTHWNQSRGPFCHLMWALGTRPGVENGGPETSWPQRPLLTSTLSAAFGAILQGSIFGVAGLLPASYTAPIMSGQGLAGFFASVAMICAIASESCLPAVAPWGCGGRGNDGSVSDPWHHPPQPARSCQKVPSATLSRPVWLSF